MISKAYITAKSRALWPGLHLSFTLMLLGFALFTLLVVRPFGRAAADSGSVDVEKQWVDNINQLGITAIYPPDESISVGDVFAVLIGSALNTPPHNSVLITHIDMRDGIRQDSQAMPVLADGLGEADDAATPVDRAGPPPANAPIPLHLVAFPGITIRSSTQAGSSLGGIFGLLANRQMSAVKEIKITSAMAYGVTTETALGALQQLCAHQGNHYCDSAYLCKLVGATLGQPALDPPHGGPPAHLELLVISRVYLTKEIDEQTVFADASNAAASFGAAEAVAGEQDRPAGRADDTGGQSSAASAAAAATGGARGRASLGRHSQSAVELNQVFARPIAFGYNSVSIALENPNCSPDQQILPAAAKVSVVSR